MMTSLADGMGIFRGDLRVGVGHGEDDRIRGHAGDHLGGEGALGREAEQDVGAGGGLFQGAEVGVGGKELLVRVHPFGAPLVDDPLGVAHDHVVRLDPQGDGQLGAGVGRGAGAVDDDADVLDLLADQHAGR